MTTRRRRALGVQGRRQRRRRAAAAPGAAGPKRASHHRCRGSPPHRLTMRASRRCATTWTGMAPLSWSSCWGGRATWRSCTRCCCTRAPPTCAARPASWPTAWRACCPRRSPRAAPAAAAWCAGRLRRSRARARCACARARGVAVCMRAHMYYLIMTDVDSIVINRDHARDIDRDRSAGLERIRIPLNDRSADSESGVRHVVARPTQRALPAPRRPAGSGRRSARSGGPGGDGRWRCGQARARRPSGQRI